MSESPQSNDITSRIKMRRKVCERVLKRDFVNLKEYFLEATKKKNSCLVFISRRCYVLYQIIAEIEHWNHETIVTDWGLFAFKHKIKECKSVIVIDDIGLTGSSMQRVLKTVDKYVSLTCRIEAMLFAINIENIGKLKRIHISNFKTIKLKSYYQLTNRQCQELSKKLVAVILKCGMSYTTFVYPIFGKETGRFVKENEAKGLKSESMTLKEYKWETTYITDLKDSKYLWTQYISDFNCIRVYRNKENERFSLIIPILFMKPVMPDKIDTFFTTFSKQFEKVGADDISVFIKDSLDSKKAMRKNAVEYLMCFFTCFCTKNLLDIMDITKCMIIQEDVAINSLRGSFTPNVIDFLKNSNADVSLKFWQGIDLDAIANCLYSQTEKQYVKYEELKKYVERERKKPIFEVTCGVFQLMRELSINDKTFRSIAFEELFNLLKNEGGFDAEDIYLAQIECWDRGIATYSFEYSETRGAFAKCSVGEMSSVLYMLKYNELLRKFYEKNYFCEKRLTDEQRKNNLREVIEETKKEGKITEEEIRILYELIQHQQGGIYNLLI